MILFSKVVKKNKEVKKVGDKVIRRAYGMALTWPMGWCSRSFRRGPYPSRYSIRGPFRFYSYEYGVAAKSPTSSPDDNPGNPRA